VDLLRVSDAARLIGCSETWLRKAERKGKIPAARRDINGWRVYDDKDIEVLRKLILPTNNPDSGVKKQKNNKNIGGVQ
jgi:DNA-binding transcriptional MerR regulator